MKKILLVLAVALSTVQVWAADVSESQAKAAAGAFLTRQVKAGRLNAVAASNLKLVKAEASVAKSTAVDYYIYNTDRSYVVVSGDDLAPQILMYGEEGPLDLDNVPPGMQWLLNKYKYQIDGLKAGTLAPVSLPKTATTPVAPLVTANWDQTAPYYNHTPTSGSTHAYTGCPATSLAMCFYLYKWPKTYPALAAIPADNYYGYLAAPALAEKAADWDNIIDEYTGPTNYDYTNAQAEAVSWLMRYVGQACNMGYSTSGSGATDPEILQACHTFGYTNAQLLTLCELQQSGWGGGYTNGPQQYTDAQWNEWMMNELQNGRPIEYLAYDCSNSYSPAGHAFNVFGCNSSGQYYVNWGWSGDSNGYCTLHNFTTATGATGESGSYVFNYGEAMIIGIEPPATGPTISVTPNNLDMVTTVGSTVTSTFKVTGSNLTSDVNLSCDGQFFTIDKTTVGMNAAEGGVVVTVTYSPTTRGTHTGTITLTSSDAETVTVTLNGTAELVKNVPVMLPADEQYINLTKFRADWTDATPAENVASYTLQVSSRNLAPELIGSVAGTDFSGSATGYYSITLPAPWGGANVRGGLNSIIYFRNNYNGDGSYGNITYTIPAEYENAVFTVKLTTATTSDGSGNLEVTTPSTSTVNHNFAAGETYSWLVTASAGEKIIITTPDDNYSPDIAKIEIYSGDATASMLRASETGDENSRTIKGITDKFYTVENLASEGTFQYMVKAVYIDGTESTWSNIQEVTLFANGHGYVKGDVNHDNQFNITDVITLVNYLSNASEICMICADYNGDNNVNISDAIDMITALQNAAE